MRAVVMVTAAVLLLGGCHGGRNVPLGDQAMGARTPAEHTAVAKAYRERAERFLAESAEHAKLAEWWSSLAGGASPGTGTGRYEEAQHCRRLAALLSDAAREADAMADAHVALGGAGR